MQNDPRKNSGKFGELFKDIRRCKESKTCPDLDIRPYYFEPNPVTIEEWREDGFYRDAIDRRLVFVCESPGGSAKRFPGFDSPETKRCWCNKNRRNEPFLKILLKNGFQNCYITNTVKCGPRRESRHTDCEFEACLKFLSRELELIHPSVVVGVGGKAAHTLRTRILKKNKLSFKPRIFQITHYSAWFDTSEIWEQEFSQLKREISK